jgi:ribosomal protein L7/L12
MENVVYGLLSLVTVMTLVIVIQLYARVVHLQRHMFLLLRHHGIDPTKPPEVSDRVKELARDPARKIEAIKLMREETGADLAEAKGWVEEYARGTRS